MGRERRRKEIDATTSKVKKDLAFLKYFHLNRLLSVF